ncbi:MAG: ring-opening amidohydrolase [Chloroflexota bacterium]|nr:ring-opening amidohydrolase [Chloroflexota bacterium]
MEAQVFSVEMDGPSDVSGVARLIDQGALRPEDVVCVLGKTEGNGLVNDFSRGYATLAFKGFFSERLGIPRDEVGERIAFIMSGGTEGVMTPHCTVFARRDTAVDAGAATMADRKRLAISQAFTRDFLPEEIGRMPQVREMAEAVRQAMAQAGIANAADVHFVQVKCPLLTAGRMHEATERGQTVATEDTYESMGFSRGASALGIALALGEVPEAALRDEVIHSDWGLYSSVASTSAGIELMRNEIILMGNSPSWSGDLVVGHTEMRDAIDAEAVRQALRAVSCCAGPLPTSEELSRVVNLFAKAEAAPSAEVRGRRHTMLDDSDINSTRHARAVVNAVIAAIVGDPMVYVSGGAEHQGPAGGGPVAVIARASDGG